ncbi:MAG: hypothetical protein IJ901_08600 [Bacteroidaceae bacterium]|nr:hypothetical protein [Bacteroidaceae bacterium]
MKLIYFHGFGSSGASGTVETLRNLLPQATIIAPDIPVDPVDALPYLKQLCETEQPDIIVGTSMGGMYAQQMRGFLRICVNPAFNMSTNSQVMKTGTYKFQNGRKDNQKEFRITKDIIQHHNQMERQQFKNIPPEDQELCYGLFGINDPVVHTYDLFKKHYPHAIRFEGEHRLNDKVIRKTLLPLIQQLLGDKLQG